jgi:acyl dehydratase
MTDDMHYVVGKTYDELELGSRARSSARTVTETDLVNFVTLCGFSEPLFLDARAAAEAGYAGRLVPGALTYCIAEGLVMQTNQFHNTGLAFLGMQLDAKAAVFVGDTIYAVSEVVERRPASDGTRGVVRWRVTVLNQDDHAVLEYWPTRLIRGHA